jgi:quercetin dioxygenase-like cupin family protein
MHLTKLADARPEHRAGWGTQTSIDLSWLIDADLGGPGSGAVGRMKIAAGAAQAAHRHPGAEEMMLVLDGRGVALVGGQEQPIEAGNLLFAPAGAAHSITAGEQPLDMLVVIDAADAAAAGWEDAAESFSATEARLLSGLEADEMRFDDPAAGFVAMHGRWVVDSAICGARGTVIGRSRFAVGGLHDLHRHPGAAEFFMLLAGEGAHFAQDGSEVAVVPGDVALLPRGSWHGFRNKGDREARAVFGFLGAADFDATGYELPFSRE